MESFGSYWISLSSPHSDSQSRFVAPILVIKTAKANICWLPFNVAAADFFRMDDPPFLLLQC